MAMTRECGVAKQGFDGVMGVLMTKVAASTESKHLSLVCHTRSPTPAVHSIKAEISMTSGGDLRLRYQLEGELDQLAIPARAPSVRAGELWRHTCFEAFIAGSGSPGYCELNFSPSTQWAAYSFERYREEMAPLDCEVFTPLEVRYSHDRLELEAAITCKALRALPASGAMRMALAAVVEEKQGRCSYWALAHPPDSPDFHHPDSFVLHLQRPVHSVTSSAAVAPS